MVLATKSGPADESLPLILAIFFTSRVPFFMLYWILCIWEEGAVCGGLSPVPAGTFGLSCYDLSWGLCYSIFPL